MSVGLLLVTHEDLGEKLVSITNKILGNLPLNIACLNIGYECAVDEETLRAKTMYAQIDQGDGVLIITDIYGSTPCNIASKLESENKTIVIAGLNLPMLVRVLNYPDLSLQELADKAVSGGHNGIFLSSEANLDSAADD